LGKTTITTAGVPDREQIPFTAQKRAAHGGTPLRAQFDGTLRAFRRIELPIQRGHSVRLFGQLVHWGQILANMSAMMTGVSESKRHGSQNAVYRKSS